jgi:cytochrome c-type biogenesis protein CcmH/NrfG
MGFALYETGDYPGAQRFFESATRLDRGQLNAYYGLALAARAQRNPEVAVGAMRTWLHLAPPDDPFRAKANRFLEEMQASG